MITCSNSQEILPEFEPRTLCCSRRQPVNLLRTSSLIFLATFLLLLAWLTISTSGVHKRLQAIISQSPGHTRLESCHFKTFWVGRLHSLPRYRFASSKATTPKSSSAPGTLEKTSWHRVQEILPPGSGTWTPTARRSFWSTAFRRVAKRYINRNCLFTLSQLLFWLNLLQAKWLCPNEKWLIEEQLKNLFVAVL